MMRHLTILLACGLSQAAAADPIYKCTDGGRISYSDRPCGRTATALAVPEAPAPDPESAARLERERAALQLVEKEHAARALVEEREAARARREAAGLRRRCEKLRLNHKWAEEDTRRTSGAALEAARIKARRQAEALAVECPA